jgi:hypothetical protein
MSANRRWSAPAAALALLVAATAPHTARADDKTDCVEAYQESQRLRRAGDHVAARRSMRVCARIVCPAFIQNDCVEWEAAEERDIASVIVSAAAGGHEVIDGRLFVDGELRASRLDGRAIELDPGERTFRVEREGRAPVEWRVVLIQGEKNRVLTMPPDEAAPPPRAPETAAPPRAADASPARPVPRLTYALAGGGVLALSVAAVLAVTGLERKHALLDGAEKCAPFCEDATVDGLRTRFIVAGSLAAVGTVAVGAALVVFVTRPTSPPSTGAALRVRPGATGTSLLLEGRF